MIRLGLAVCGSFCTFDALLGEIAALRERFELLPILSAAANETDTRFGLASAFVRELREQCGHEPITDIVAAEAIGPRKLLDVLAVVPCTGNTLGKLAAGVADSTVTFACKAHLRNGAPVVLAVSTNDGLSASAANIGTLLNRKHYYFVPFGQDDPIGKPYSLKSRLELLGDTAEAALNGRQLQPVLVV